MEAPLRELPQPPGEPVELQAELLLGEQVLARRIGVRVVGEQSQGGEVITEDPRGGALVEDVGPVGQAQRQSPARSETPSRSTAPCVGSACLPAGSKTVSNEPSG